MLKSVLIIGIYIYYSNRDSIINNNIMGNSIYAINIESSVGITLNNNSMKDSGIFLGGANIEHWNTHIIDISNTLNEN